jgi:hypothetical protein
VLKNTVPFVMAATVFLTIRELAGQTAAIWFGVGFIVCSIMAAWEIGGKSVKGTRAK